MEGFEATYKYLTDIRTYFIDKSIKTQIPEEMLTFRAKASIIEEVIDIISNLPEELYQ